MSYKQVTLTGTYTDAQGNPASGDVMLYVDAPVVDTTLKVTVVVPTIEAKLDSTGKFTTVPALLANDNAGLTLFNWWFVPHISGVPVNPQKLIPVNLANGATQDITAL